MIEDTWSIYDLPARVFIVSVTYEQVLRSESIRLYIDIGIRDIIDEAGLADVGEACDN